jgi:hypothetical protein
MKKYLGFDDLLEFCKMMSASQGFYGRLYRTLLEFDERQKQEIEQTLEEKQFTDTLDFVFWLECE